MPHLGRRGLTLIELVVTVALLGAVAGGIYRVLLTSQRTYLAQAQRVELQQNLRAAGAILPAAFRELNAADSDIAAMSATAITIRTTDQFAFLCVPPEFRSGGELALSVRQRPFFGVRRTFSAGDSVLLYYEGDPATRDDDTWVRGQIIAAASRDCPDPDELRPGYELRMHPQRVSVSGFNLRDGITNGSPLRGFATVTYELYRSSADKQWYLGQQVAGGTVQPLLGPLIGPSGLTLSYYDSTGAPTTTPTAVAAIEIRVRGRTARDVDSLVTRVALRNNPR